MPYTVAGIPGKFHLPGEREDNASIVWRATLAGGRIEVSTHTTDQRDATRFALDWLERGGGAAVPEGPVTIEAAAEAYIAFADPRKDDVKWARAIASHFDNGRKPIGEIVHADLVKAATVLLPGRANATRNRYVLDVAGRILHYAHEQGWCAYLRVKRFWVSRKSSRKPAADATIARLRKHTTGQERALLGLLFESGLRITACVDMARNDDDLRQRRIASPLTKNDSAIYLTISAGLARELLALPAHANGRLFTWHDRHGVYRWLAPLCKRLKVHYTPHLSRHALATELGRLKIPDKQAAANGAWEDPRSLHRYQEVVPDAVPGRTIARLKAAGGKDRVTLRSRLRVVAGDHQSAAAGGSTGGKRRKAS